jgi:DNA mismatch repair protein MutS
MMLDDYHNYITKYRQIYGEKTVIFLQNGSFFETYGVNNEYDKYGCDNIVEIANLLNITVTRKNKSIIENSRTNALMSGFPCYILNKYVEILIDNNYTVIVVEQFANGKKFDRRVTNIFSPSTYTENIKSYEEKYLMTIYLCNSFDYNTKNKYIGCSIAIYDITTGKSYIYDTPNNLNDTKLVLDEIYRIKQIYMPKEVIIFGEILEDLDCNNIINFLELSNNCVHNKLGNFEKKILNINYQCEIMKKIFINTGLLTPIEYCNLEKNPNSVIAFVYLLEFIFEHDSNNLKCVFPPEILTNSNKLILEFNCIKKLNIVSQGEQNIGKNSSLLNILNNCVSPNGKRYFKNCLLNPITNIEEIEDRYNNIGIFLTKTNNNYLYTIIRKELTSIIDLERSLIKLSNNKFQPNDFVSVKLTLEKIINIIKILEDNQLSSYNPPNSKKLCNEFINYLNQIFNFEELPKYNLDNINNSFYKEGFNTDIDEIQENLNKNIKYFEKLCYKLNTISKEFSSFFKHEYNERDGNYLTITAKRFNQVKKFIQEKKNNKVDITIDDIEDTFNNLIDKLTPNKTTVKLTSSNISKINENIYNYKDNLKKKIIDLYHDICDKIYQDYYPLLNMIIKFINKIDFYTNNAYNSIKFNYCRPTIDKNAEKSYFNATNIRHPIIEIINTDIPYITNDIKLGIDNQDSIILYGCNAVGKSSTMKAIGLNIIMAQAGMFVPCSNFVYSPYFSLFSRIPSGDDLFKGQSTFTVELAEIRNILKKADKNSLIIGDEVNSGTEAVSAISIITTSIIELSKKQSSFIFASHLHELKNIQEIQEIKTLKIYHMTIHFDSITKNLIFDRKIKTGGGSLTYGLEILKSYDFELDFLKTAELIKKKLLKEKLEIIPNKKSRYNKSKFIDNCQICGSNDNLETHHIRFQSESDSNGNIDKKFNKNIKHNLTILCNLCHDKLHNNNIQINGYKYTTNGIKLDYHMENTIKKINLESVKKFIQHKTS